MIKQAGQSASNRNIYEICPTLPNHCSLIDAPDQKDNPVTGSGVIRGARGEKNRDARKKSRMFKPIYCRIMPLCVCGVKGVLAELLMP